MTTEQAVAILEAEQILQDVGCEGPDANVGSAWYNYVVEAASVVANDKLLRTLCDHLHLLEG